MQRTNLKIFLLAAAVLYGITACAQTTLLTDELQLGNPQSEQSHLLIDDNSEVIKGGLKQNARVLLPPAQASWTGGKIAFNLKVDPDKQNYITAKFWGNDISTNRLFLLCGGMQVGYRHIGDIDMLDVGTEDPLINDRFFYTTLPLPLKLTKGKTMLQFEIRSNGPIWGYGQNWAQYQKNMSAPTRGIYAIYTHTNGTFVPPVTEAMGKAPQITIRTSPGQEVINQVKNRLNNEINSLISQDKPLSQVQMQFLAKAYQVKWSYAYQNKLLVNKVLSSLSALYLAYKANPELAQGDPATYNPEWFGLGICGQVLYLLNEQLGPMLDMDMPGLSGKISCRAAFTDMLVACRNWHQRNRRMYSNQSMINDLYGIYYANKGLQNINPAKALPEQEMLRYFYESLGMQPWLGSETEQGPSHSAGDNYWELTKKGLTKELGYVGNYGEVLDWVTEIYDATRLKPDMPGNQKIKDRIEEIALARSYFRYPAFDKDGFKAMRMETIVGWRDNHYPGDITYAQRDSWDGTALQIAAATLSPKLVGFTRQMLDDNQFFSVMEAHIKDKGFRVTAGLLNIPDQLEVIKAQPLSKYRLPASSGQPDFVFSDEEDGVLAVKNGDEMLYASLYWRARSAVNFLARVHYINPVYNNIATIYQQEEFEPSGLFYTRRDYTNMGFGNGGIKYPDGLHSANAGEKEPIAKIPAGVPYQFEDENPYAGRASFYRLQYGHYLIGMNNSDHNYQLNIPKEFNGALNLSSRQRVGAVSAVTVKPGTTVVLYIKK